MNKLFLIVSVFLFYTSTVLSQWQSNIVKFDANGKLSYTSDSEGNKIPDFSYAGYKNGTVDLPVLAVRETISPVDGDNTTTIQNAINAVAALTPDLNGFRGAVLMTAGKYSVSGTIRINASGVVLRGVGNGSDPAANTIIASTGGKAQQEIVIIAGGGNASGTPWSDRSGSNILITSDVVYVGDKEFTAASTDGFAVGDNIVIVHPKTEAWVHAVDHGGTGETEIWHSQNLDIKYNRYITAINSTTKQITIDAPVFNTLKKSLSQSYFYKTTRVGILTNIGVENLRIDILNPLNESTTKADGNVNDHSAYGLMLARVEDAWVKNVTTLHWSENGFSTYTGTRVTYQSCKAIEPIGKIQSGYRSNFFCDDASQLVLFSNCFANYGRHSLSSGGRTTVSGIVAYNFTADRTYASSEGHLYWSQGILCDNWKNSSAYNTSECLGFYNRGSYGTGHGWAAVHSVIWGGNISGDGNFIVQKPPTAQNYAIGCIATVKGTGPYPGPAGYIEGVKVVGINPPSLYLAQLKERTGITPVVSAANIDGCETTTGWKNAATLIVNSTSNKEGAACIEFVGESSTEFAKVFTPAINPAVTTSNGVLKFWYYISDVSLITGVPSVEIGSAGVADVNEYSWQLSGLVNGWNQISLDLNKATTVLGGDGPNLSAINWFRIYNTTKTATITTRIDAIELVAGAPAGMLQHSTGYSVYPNPVSDRLFIDGLEGVAKVSVLKITGEEIYTTETAESLSLKNIAPGFYFLKIGNDKPIKFVKK